MHKDFYASGFIYHLPTQQILLQQHSSSSFWLLFGGKNSSGESPTSTFCRVIQEQLQINITPKIVYPVYDYFNKAQGKHHYFFYIQLKNKKEFTPRKEYAIEWLTFKKLYKLALTEQTRQDITVGQRVINAVARDKESEKIVTLQK